MRVATNGFVPVNTPVRPATGLSDGLADMLGQLMSEQMTNESRKWIEARRSARILIQIQLLVRWTPEGELPLTEETSTVAVNAHGALITLALRVKPGNKLILRNWGTAMEREVLGSGISARRLEALPLNFWSLPNPILRTGFELAILIEAVLSPTARSPYIPPTNPANSRRGPRAAAL
jgi:hypothetical protein